MEFEIGSVIKMKKPHPCGENRWEILRVGMDFRLKCQASSNYAVPSTGVYRHADSRLSFSDKNPIRTNAGSFVHGYN